MLEKINIKRFKSIRSCSLEFGRVNIFIGFNGAGKSNFLEAIGIVSSALDRGIDDVDLSNKGIRQTPPALMKSAHKSHTLPATLEIEAIFKGEINYKFNLTSNSNDKCLRFHSESCKLKGKQIFSRSGKGSSVLGHGLMGSFERNRGLWDQVKAVFNFEDYFTETLESFSEYKIFSPQTEFLRGVKGGVAYNPPVGLRGEGLAEAVKQLILQTRSSNTNESSREISSEAIMLSFLPGWNDSVQVGRIKEELKAKIYGSENKNMIYFIDRYMHDSRNKLSAYDSSEGTLFLLFVAVLLAHKSAPKCFAIDNIDNALNPLLTRNLVESLISITKRVDDEGIQHGAKQVFLTSHNPTSIDAFDIFDDQQRVFVVSRDPKGGTVANRLIPPEGYTREDWAIASGGKNLSQLWIEGAIPGLSTAVI